MITATKMLAPGDVVMAVFPEHVPPGHEQFGYRHAVVVGLPNALGPLFRA